MDKIASHYAVLDIPPSSNSASIRRAYLRRCLEWHPDRASGSASATLFARATAAYEVLSDGARRERYDATLRRVVTDVVALDDMEWTRDEEGGRWMQCRCGGGFHVDECAVREHGGAAVVECDTCSLAIRAVDCRAREDGTVGGTGRK